MAFTSAAREQQSVTVPGHPFRRIFVAVESFVAA